MPTTLTPETQPQTKKQILVDIRQLLESDRKSDFFNAQEVKDIVEYIYGEQDFQGSATKILPEYIKGWKKQPTSGCHPSRKNCEIILELMLENTIFEDETEDQTEDQTDPLSAAPQTGTEVSLIDFIRSISPEMAKNIVRFERSNEKTFIITLR